MIATHLVLALALGLPGAAPPQPGEGQAATKADARAMAEDVEILRRLLVQRLQGWSVGAGDMMNPASHWRRYAPLFESLVVDLDARTNPNAPGQASRNLQRSGLGSIAGGLEGTYLKGYGIVYTVTLPPPIERPAPPAAAPPAKRLSDWERLRREVRGEKTETAEGKPEVRRPSLTEAILTVLAENGRNLAHLPANEVVSVIVTFRAPGGATLVSELSTGTGDALWLDPERLSVGTGSTLWLDVTAANQPRPAGDSATPAQPAPARPSSLSTVRDYRLLGEVSEKKGNYDEAVRAYEAAVQLAAGDRTYAQEVREMYRKMAQAHLAKGDVDAARKVLDKAAALPRQPAKPKPAGAASLPAKLILSAPKGLLDQVGAKRIGFEEFVKQVTLHYFHHE
jgi:hypothetical protein